MTTIRVTAPAGRLIPGIGSFEFGETFNLPHAEAEALVAASTGLELVQPAGPGRRSKIERVEAEPGHTESEG